MGKTLPGGDTTKELATNLKHWKKVIEEVDKLAELGSMEAVYHLQAMAMGFDALAESLNNVATSINKFNPEFIGVLAEVSGG